MPKQSLQESEILLSFRVLVLDNAGFYLDIDGNQAGVISPKLSGNSLYVVELSSYLTDYG